MRKCKECDNMNKCPGDPNINVAFFCGLYKKRGEENMRMKITLETKNKRPQEYILFQEITVNKYLGIKNGNLEAIPQVYFIDLTNSKVKVMK